MKIDKLVVRRFKQLNEFELDFSDTTVLIGANNSGKSSALQALHFAVSVAQTAKLVARGVRWSNDRFLLSFNPSQLIYTPIADVMSLANDGVLREEADSQIEIGIRCDDGSECSVVVRRGRNQNLAVAIQGRSLGETLMDLDRPFTVYAPGLAGIAKEERFMSAGAVRRVVARGDANLVLRNVLLMLKKAGEADSRERDQEILLRRHHAEVTSPGINVWERFVGDMRALFPGISIDVQFDESRDETIAVFFERPGKPRLPIDAAGTSILQASQILAYVALFKPSVLILDEPDSHLHPNNQRVLCDLITELAAQRGFRALLSTHSRHVLDALNGRARVEWLSNGSKVDYESVTLAAQLMDIGALDSLDYFTDSRLRCLFATEDSNKESLAALAALLESNGFLMADTDIRAYSGCSKIDSAKVLRRFLRDKAPTVKFVVHRDRDYMTDEHAASFEREIEAVDARPLLTARSDVEGYFLNADHLASLNEPLTREQILQIIAQATTDTAEQSIEQLINIRTERALKERNGGPPLNAGQLAATARADYLADSEKWRRGKLVLRRVKALMQTALGRNPVLFRPSAHLADPAIRSIRAFVWPQDDAATP